ncbi:MAG: DUF2231 domain-containing protein [Gemmatimonas sp.]
MPNLAANHPQVVHFAIALLFVGVAFRFIALTGKLKFTNYAATTLLILGTVAAVLSVKSGTDAHGPVERIPGARALVQDHEEHGIKTRNQFLGVVALELLALGLAAGAKTAKFAKFGYMASAVLGFFAAHQLYEAGEHGGELVYSYAGGPGLRTGNPEDVDRLLLAGLYNQSQADRKAGRSVESARLVNEMTVRFPNDTTIRFLHAESLLLDTKDNVAALAAVQAIGVDTANARLRTRKGTLTADIFLAMGQADSAKAVLTPLVTAYPTNTRLKAKLDSIK